MIDTTGYVSDRLSIQWSKWIGVTRSHSSTVDDDQQQQCICIQDTQKYRAFPSLVSRFQGTSLNRNIPSLDSDENVTRSAGGQSQSFVITLQGAVEVTGYRLSLTSLHTGRKSSHPSRHCLLRLNVSSHTNGLRLVPPLGNACA